MGDLAPVDFATDHSAFSLSCLAASPSLLQDKVQFIADDADQDDRTSYPSALAALVVNQAPYSCVITKYTSFSKGMVSSSLYHLPIPCV